MSSVCARISLRWLLLTLASVSAGACSAKRGPSTGAAGAGGQTDGGGTLADQGVTLPVAGGLLRIEVCAADVIRVAYATDASFFDRATIATAPKRCQVTAFTRADDAVATTITTARVTVHIDDATGAVTFLDPSGAPILGETATGRTVTPATVQGEATTSVRQEWTPNEGESLYGLGQHQHGLFDIKGTDLDLHQYNTEVFIPYLVSSNGYGILWDNTSFTRFGDLGDPVPLPVAPSSALYATGAKIEAGDVAPGRGAVTWADTVIAPVTGDYTFRTFSSGAIKLSVNGQVVVDHWRQGWAPDEDLAHVSLTAGQVVPVALTWTADLGVPIVRLLWKPPVAGRTTSLWSQVADGIDYYFVYGPELDQVVAGYRRLTGDAPMMPRWAYGFWQSRDHYQTAQEITDVLAGYRTRQAPIDNIVQDWQYWPLGEWGSHAFDPMNYPDPAGWIQTIHDTYHAHLMISVWPKFYPPGFTPSGTYFTADNYTALDQIHGVFQSNILAGNVDFLKNPFTFYDAFNPDARQLYWSQIDGALFSKGMDAWWMDATEPEIVEGPFTSPAVQIDTNQTHMNPTAAGSGARVLNGYSLMNSRAIYEGQRAAAPNQRVFILTRSGFAGQQRYAATTWSGDVTSTWSGLRKQIPAGLSIALSGIPYWTLDSGGYILPPFLPTAATSVNAHAADEWYELATRWFEYATFLPIMRVHGKAPPREIWQFGGDGSPAYQAMLKFDRLRYRLLPYIYSLAGAVTQHAGTILRPLVMDFRADATARAIGDQYLFGPALMVSPVTTYQARARPVYLPTAQDHVDRWYDLWTGTAYGGGQTIDAAPAPFDAIPIYARAGAILPVGPDLQYTDQLPADPITLFVYAGADGAFTLYEDQGTTFDYESGHFANIPITWTDATRTLTLGARSGSFAEMLASRTFQVVVVDGTAPVAFPDATPGGTPVTYDGSEKAIPF